MRKFFRGFVFAGRGIFLATNERNMRFHLVVTWAVILLGSFLHITRTEWIILFFAIAMVLFAETCNTALEYVVNLIRDECGVPYKTPNLGRAKDVAAGSVLIVALFAALIGILVFAPHIMTLFV